MSPPFNLTENPEFMAMVTFTWPLTPVSAMVTVPTDPVIARLFEVRLNVIESAEAAGTKPKPITASKESIDTFRLEKRTVIPSGSEFLYSRKNTAREWPVYLLQITLVRH